LELSVSDLKAGSCRRLIGIDEGLSQNTRQRGGGTLPTNAGSAMGMGRSNHPEMTTDDDPQPRVEPSSGLLATR
jgi:hypothetical protein